MPKISQGALKISLVYIVAGGLWISFSDQLLSIFLADARTFTMAAIFKGWLFIFLTGVMLYRLITQLLEKIHKAQLLHEEEIHRLNRLYDVLSQVNRALSGAKSEPQFLQKVLTS